MAKMEEEDKLGLVKVSDSSSSSEDSKNDYKSFTANTAFGNESLPPPSPQHARYHDIPGTEEPPVDIVKKKNKVVKCKSVCVAALLLLCVMPLLFGIVGMNVYFAYEHRPASATPTTENNQFIVLPANSSYDLKVDSTKYNAVSFTFSSEKNRETANVRFVLRATDTTSPSGVDYSATLYEVLDGTCEYSEDINNELPPENCFVYRYWPLGMAGLNPDGTLRCKSLTHKEPAKSHLVWKWFNTSAYGREFDYRKQFIECPNDLHYFHKCTSDDQHALNVKRILQHQDIDNGDTVIMRFCVDKKLPNQEPFDTVEYTVNFTEHRPFLQEPYNMYSMGRGTRNEAVVVPLVKNIDNSIRIITDSNQRNNQPIELQYKLHVVYPGDQQRGIVFGGSVAITVVTVVTCMIIFVVLCTVRGIYKISK